MADNVNHPSHYETGQFECIDVMVETQGVEATMNFCVCNALKYIYRHKRKNGIEDIQKAIWYLNKAEELYRVLNAPVEGVTYEKAAAQCRKTQYETCWHPAHEPQGLGW